MICLTGFRAAGTLALLLFTLAACTTMQPLDLPRGEDGLSGSVLPGDIVRITTRSGEQHVIEVSAVTESEISGEGRVFVLEEIEKLEVRRTTAAGKSAALGGVLVGTIAFYALLFALIGSIVAAGI